MRSMLLLISVLNACCALKVLIYNPKFAFSHMTFTGSIADALHAAGHNVTVLQPIINPDHRGTGCKNARVLQVEQNNETLRASEALKKDPFWAKGFTEGEIWGAYELVNKLEPVLKASCNDMLSKKVLIEELRNEKFDIGINEYFDFCGFPLFYEMGIFNVVGTSSYNLPEWVSLAMGIPLIPSYVPASQGVTGNDISAWSRMKNLLFTFLAYRFQRIQIGAAENAVRTHYPHQPSIWDITKTNTSFVLTNSDSLRDFPRPTPYGVVNIGGIGMKESHELDEEWIKILSLRPKTVLVSFGTLGPTRNVPENFRRTMAKVFSKFPDVTFIWKYELDEDFVKSAQNIYTTEWMPQGDLLISGKIDLFITHGGAGSITEASYYAVPSIVVPLFGDQPRNGRMIERLGTGLYFNKNGLSDERKFEEIVRRGLEDSSLRENASKMRRILNKRPFSPDELVVKTIELAAEVGPGGYLLPDGRNMGWIAYFNVDIAFIALTVILIVAIALKCIVQAVMTYYFSKKCQKIKTH